MLATICSPVLNASSSATEQLLVARTVPPGKRRRPTNQALSSVAKEAKWRVCGGCSSAVTTTTGSSSAPAGSSPAVRAKVRTRCSGLWPWRRSGSRMLMLIPRSPWSGEASYDRSGPPQARQPSGRTTSNTPSQSRIGTFRSCHRSSPALAADCVTLLAARVRAGLQHAVRLARDRADAPEAPRP